MLFLFRAPFPSSAELAKSPAACGGSDFASSLRWGLRRYPLRGPVIHSLIVAVLFAFCFHSPPFLPFTHPLLLSSFPLIFLSFPILYTSYTNPTQLLYTSCTAPTQILHNSYTTPIQILNNSYTHPISILYKPHTFPIHSRAQPSLINGQA